MTVRFTRAVYVYYTGGYDPENPAQWIYSDASGGGVGILSVSLSEGHMYATITLSGPAGGGDIITAGDFHTKLNPEGDAEICFTVPDSATRGEDGIWNLNIPD